MRTRRNVLRLVGSAVAASWLTERPTFAQKPRRILMLGGTGFIGPHIVHAALARGHQVSMLNRGRRAPNQNAGDFARVEALRGDRSQPDAYASLSGRTWDVVVDTANSVPWTRAAVAALRRSTGRYLYVSSTGVFWPYRTVDIPEDGPIVLADTPPQDPPSFGVMKAQSENAVRDAFPAAHLVVRPGYIVGPGDPSDRYTYWPVRISRGGQGARTRSQERPCAICGRARPGRVDGAADGGRGHGLVQCRRAAAPLTLAQFIDGLKPLESQATTYTWIEDYAWLKGYPLRAPSPGDPGGLVEAIPWVMAEGDELGHMRISNRKALAAGLTYRPLLTTARDTLTWRQSDAVPEALRTKPRYVMTAEQETAVLAAWTKG